MSYQKKMSHILNWEVWDQSFKQVKISERTGYKKTEIDTDVVDNEIQLSVSKTSIKADITKISFLEMFRQHLYWSLHPENYCITLTIE